MAKGRWVLGFAFYSTHHELNVALIEKRRGPGMLIGKLNGIGGKMEADELPVEAMRREFREEAGVDLPEDQWRYFCELRVLNWGTVYVFSATIPSEVAKQVRAMEDEHVAWYDVRKLPYYNIVPNLSWLVPMARDKFITATIEDPT